MRKPWKEKPIFPKRTPGKLAFEERGVSPVIAVILMVAITVVLAAVLYVMVMNLMDDPQENITVSMNWIETGDEPGSYAGYVIKIQGKTPYIDDITVGIVGETGIGSKKLDALAAEGNYTVGSITMNYYDANNDGKLGAEDIFMIKGVSEGDILRLTHEDAGNIATKTF